MVQGVSLSTVTSCEQSRLYGSFPSWTAPFAPFKKSQISFISERYRVWNQCQQRLFLRKYHRISRFSGFKVEAAWFFRGREQESEASAERSEMAHDDIAILLFQLSMATRVQYFLNVEQYDAAQQLRNKLTEVEAEVLKQQEEIRGVPSKSEAQDKALSIIRLRSDLQNAIESEDYDLAATLRDQISKLEAESLAASAKVLAYENAQYAFRLGQKVRHKAYNYIGVICGMDPVCCESSSWMETVQVQKLSRGSTQPFYQVLVDVQVDPNLLVAYVPEENLLAVDETDMVGSSIYHESVLRYGFGRRLHPR
ncbi:clp protease adapter protein ClpF, chloroplastic isoform X2 [Neltuma alba]|uniref:clp protease adapter protein ClpF, chloroplastic isoform X2 n=1 Tax=Neltuma alba TaxID=207710 RepID=UPI0010A4B52A|nr:clp protease adapter protein ClpF, chloroplastic-like isoform X2 [Prosopis alba]